MNKVLIYLLIIIIISIFIYSTFTENYKEYKNENYNENYTAIIVEPREHKALEFVLTNFLSNLDNRWNFIIFHGNKNKDYILNIINNKLANNKLANHKDRITLINLKVDNLTIYDYNTLFYTKEFYDYIPTEVFLVFQTDTLICENYKDIIYNFINYDYVGAPWADADWNKNMVNKVGNGGLSLRKKSKMLELLNNCKHNNVNEDTFFSKMNDACNVKINKPDNELAKTFAIETLYNNKSFGIHKSWAHIKNKEILHCKNYDKLVKLNN